MRLSVRSRDKFAASQLTNGGFEVDISAWFLWYSTEARAINAHQI